MVTEADESGKDTGGGGGAAPAPPELLTSDGPDIALETGRAGRLSWGLVGSYSVMVALLLLGQLRRVAQATVPAALVRSLWASHEPAKRTGPASGHRWRSAFERNKATGKPDGLAGMSEWFFAQIPLVPH
jgi:hypothetical protein